MVPILRFFLAKDRNHYSLLSKPKVAGPPQVVEQVDLHLSIWKDCANLHH